LGVGLGQVLTRHEVHHRRLLERKAQGTQRHVAVQEATLVNESQDLRLRHSLVAPLSGPSVEDVLGNVTRRVGGAEDELLRLPRHEYESEIDFITRNVSNGTHLSALEATVCV